MSDSYNLGTDGDYELHARRHANENHVIPHNDTIDHQADHTCICGPRCEVIKRADGSTGWLYIHHSLDGREHNE